MTNENGELIIDRSNFKENRKSYGITIQQISERTKLSNSVISNFENYTGQYTQTRTRDDNARVIIRALKELIQEKIDDMFPFGKKNNINNKEKEIRTMENDSKEISIQELAQEAQKEKKVKNKRIDGYDKAGVIVKLKDYCNKNNISFSDFCKMCGINYSTLAPYSVKNNPIMSERLMYKICNATGWNISMFEDNKTNYIGKVKSFITEDVKENNITPIDTGLTMKNEDKVIKHNNVETINKSNIKNNVEIKDQKYTYQDGKYYEEYTEIRTVKRMISKEEFLGAIQAAG